jgi:hypothetical protein
VNYKKLNDVTVGESYPIPRIEDMLNELSQAKFFTKLDLKSGYWQIPIKEEDKYKTAFICSQGLFEYNVMPFGLTNAPATFQRFMDSTLGDLQMRFAMVYLDDIIIYSKTFEEHLQHIDIILERLASVNLQLKINKCQFAMNEISYLGHIISDKGIKPDSLNIKAIKEMKPPTKVKALQRFLGMINFYRKFIPDCSKLAEPLNQLLRKDISWRWEEDQRKSFEVMKNILCSEPILIIPDFEKPFVLETDASGYAIGTTLLQEQDKILKPIAYAFIHFTDHKPLVGPFNKGHSENSRIDNWLSKTTEFQFKTCYKPGELMYTSDFLSRLEEEIDSFGDIEDATIHLIEILSAENTNKEDNLLSHDFTVDNNILFFTPIKKKKESDSNKRVVIPDQLRKKVLELFHDDPLNGGHLDQHHQKLQYQKHHGLV